MNVDLTVKQIDLLLIALSCPEVKKIIDRFDKSKVFHPTNRAEIYTILTNSLDYKDYLKTIYWKITKSMTKNSGRHFCELCRAENVELHVHHNTYERKGCENPEDLTTLCKDCHQLFHDNRKISG